MLFLRSQPLDTDDDLRVALQNAIRLEHATIPPYLTARATLKEGASASVDYAREEIKRIVVEEMMHMTLACNILNAIGGNPVIADAGEVPKFPGPLPMGVAGGLEVRVRRYSRALVQDTFMKIEEPEDPLAIPTLPQPREFATAPLTIGQFYGQIRARIDDPNLFVGDAARQVTVFGKQHLVTDVKTAQQAIDLIVQQGEGTRQLPLDQKKEVAHYYVFQQFSKGMRIAKSTASPLEVGFDPAQPITIDEIADVIQMVDDPSTVAYDEADSHIEAIAAQADSAYTKMLSALHDGFNGEPTKVQSAIDVMVGDFKDAVDTLLQQQLTTGPHEGLFAGPRYRYTA
jgi:hypothetical protein